MRLFRLAGLILLAPVLGTTIVAADARDAGDAGDAGDARDAGDAGDAVVADAGWPDCSPVNDGHFPHNGTRGPFSSVLRVNATFKGSPLFALYPTIKKKTPLVVFMHGTAAKAEMYLPNLYNYASHGFTVVFPYIKSPEADCCRRPIPPTNTNGQFILQGLEWAKKPRHWSPL